jgi:putative phosphoserine phosphatase / 1-acylglycerol-3-phosphate O-acyltransferase
METISSEIKNKRDSYIVFFDLDLTLTRAISGKALAVTGFKKGLFSGWDFINAIFLSVVFRLKLKDPYRIVGNMVRWVKGMDESTMNDLCSEVCRDTLLPSVYKDALTEIEFHKSKNAKIVILSSALKRICTDISKALNIDDIICSELEVSDGVLTGRPIGNLCFAEEKAIRLVDYCEKNNQNVSESWYYGDSISDVPALSKVGHPVCVNPDARLRKTAIKREWKILTFVN